MRAINKWKYNTRMEYLLILLWIIYLIPILQVTPFTWNRTHSFLSSVGESAPFSNIFAVILDSLPLLITLLWGSQKNLGWITSAPSSSLLAYFYNAIEKIPLAIGVGLLLNTSMNIISGASLGRRAFSLIYVSSDGEKITLRQHIFRSLSGIFSAVLYFWIVVLGQHLDSPWNHMQAILGFLFLLRLYIPYVDRNFSQSWPEYVASVYSVKKKAQA